jgi:hypothetical protein
VSLKGVCCNSRLRRGGEAVSRGCAKGYGGSRAPLPVDGRELSSEKGFAGIVSAEKASLPNKKGRLDEKLPEGRRWWEMPLPLPLMEGVGGE